MVRLNGEEFAYRPGMTLKELLDDYNVKNRKQLVFDGFVVLVNGVALTALQAQERTLQDNDITFIIPMMDGG